MDDIVTRPPDAASGTAEPSSSEDPGLDDDQPVDDAFRAAARRQLLLGLAFLVAVTLLFAWAATALGATGGGCGGG